METLENTLNTTENTNIDAENKFESLEEALEKATETETKKEETETKKEEPEEITEEMALSKEILRLQELDLEEHNNEVPNNQRKYHVSNFIKTEMIIRSAEKGCKKASFKLQTKAVRALLGLGFLVENNTLQFSLKPCDRHTWLVTFRIYSENMSNAQIFYFNSIYGTNIPLNEEKEELPEEEQYDGSGFIRSKKIILKK